MIWASPDCTTFSITAISHHRRKDPVTGNLEPVSEYARFCDQVDRNVLKLIRELKPKYFFIENPRGWNEKDVLDARDTKIHRDILPVRGHKDETHRHLD